MKHVRIIVACLVAAFALIAIAAVGNASAAEPEWGACVPAKKGHYEDSNCTKEKFKEKKGVKTYSGKYEWKPGAPATTECVAKKHGDYTDSACTKEKEKKGVPEEHKGKYEKLGSKFTAAGGAGVLSTEIYGCENAAGEAFEDARVPHADCVGPEPEPLGFTFGGPAPRVECASEHATGEAVASDEIANVSVRFTGCEFGGLPATTPGLPAGEIQVNQLKGRLGYINKTAHEVGALLEPAVAGGKFAEFEVSEGNQIIHVGEGNATEGAFYEEEHGAPTGNDGVISPVTPVNQMTHTFTQNYRIEKIHPYQPVSCRKGTSICTYSANPGEGQTGKNDTDLLNVPSKFEGGPLEALEDYDGPNYSSSTSNEGWAWSPAGEEITNTNTLEGEAEIKG